MKHATGAGEPAPVVWCGGRQFGTVVYPHECRPCSPLAHYLFQRRLGIGTLGGQPVLPRGVDSGATAFGGIPAHPQTLFAAQTNVRDTVAFLRGPHRLSGRAPTLSHMDATALVEQSEARRVAAMSSLDPDRQQRLGQFFTPGRAAQIIAAMPRLSDTGTFRILDPGAGSGALTAAIVERVLRRAPALAVEVVAVEADPTVVGFLRATLDDCQTAAIAAGTRLASHLVQGDYIELTTGIARNQGPLAEPFDLVIMNPPYSKLAANSVQRAAVRAEGVDCPNLYAAFLALGAHALTDGGQLVAITPRSFMNGPYFEAFRKHLLGLVALDRIHTFESRSTVFSDTGVLQENVILSGTRAGERGTVELATSTGAHDVATVETVPYTAIVNPGDTHQFIRLVPEADRAIADLMAAMPAALSDLELTASTGRVVDFRSRDLLREGPGKATAPLIYPGNLTGGDVQWPKAIRKAQALDISDPDMAARLLMPAGCYVLVKRFSSKEERRRVVAAVWRGDEAPAFENHLNVFHHSGGGLEPELAVGLSYWLNSTTVDRYFRTFSGHTQVNATDLRTLRYPPLSALRALGQAYPIALPEQALIDAAVTEYLLP